MPRSPHRRTPKLSVVRRRIDHLDGRLLRLLNQRAQFALLIGRIKKRKKWPVFDARRETVVLRHVARVNRGPLSPRAVRHIFQAILSECRRRERAGRRKK
jgi:chorismate mutase